MNSDKLVASECDVFTPDKLNYFFVGRPSYKYDGDTGEAEYWELPCCFVFEFNSIKGLKRVFPFDSGAFRKRMYPNYISKMQWQDFDAGGVPDAPQKIIGAFFGSTNAYFKLTPKDKMSFEAEFSLGVFDEELRALHKLSMHKASSNFDDRRFSIEVQSEDDVDLRLVKPLAVIAPNVYYDDNNFRNCVANKWEAKAISYPIYSLSVSNYYALIYERVEALYKSMGVM
ncbi:hypothetical protein ACW7BC_18170 [Azospirillum argentinense]